MSALLCHHGDIKKYTRWSKIFLYGLFDLDSFASELSQSELPLRIINSEQQAPSRGYDTHTHKHTHILETALIFYEN